jgi:hypothetical protein
MGGSANMALTPDDIARLMSENLDDTDVFGNENFWDRTFQSLIDEGDIEFVDHAVRNHFPSDHVLEVGKDYVLMGVYVRAADDNLRKLKIPFRPDQTLKDWLNQSFVPALNQAEHEYGYMTKDQHPLFFESEGRPWGWQYIVTPVLPGQASGGEGLDDTDEFLTGDENYLITITNTNYPGKQLAGMVGFKEGSHVPSVLSLDRNDWKFSEDFAKKIVWSAWWVSDEAQHGEASYNAKDLDPGEMLQMDQGGIEMLKYYNDPEYYNSSKNPKSVYKKNPENPAGWGKVGTHTYGEAHETPFTVHVDGKPFTKIYGRDLMNLQMDSNYRIAQDDYLHASADQIEVLYDMFIYWAPNVDLEPYYEGAPAIDPYEGPDLDDRDEFEADDPEIEHQRWEDAETQGGRAIREQLLKDFAKISKPGFTLLYVGTKTTLDHRLRPFVIIGRRRSVTEDIDDKDEFRSQFVRPNNVAGHAYEDNTGENAALIYDFEDGARLYYLTNSNTTKFILREPDGTVHGTPEFNSSHDAPAWFDPYYQGMMIASVHESNGKGMWARGLIQPFTPQQSREWSQMTGSPVVREALDDKDEFRTYKLHIVCGWCQKDLGFKPVDDPKLDGRISHGMCRDCQVKQYRQMGMEPPPVTEDLDDKDEFKPVGVEDICSKCDEAVGAEFLKPVASGPYGQYYENLCEKCLEIFNSGPADDQWLREDIDDKDEFLSEKNYIHAWVKWPEGKFAGPDEAVAAALEVMANNGHIITIEDLATFKPTNKDLPTRWQYEKVGIYAYAADALIEELKSEGDIVYGSTQREPWVAFCVDVGDNERYFPPPPEPEDRGPRSFYWGRGSYEESSPTDIAHTINEDMTIDLAGYLNSQQIRPWTYAPGAGNSPRFSVRPGHDFECVDEESGLMDRNGKDITKEFQEKQMIYTYIDTWAPPQDPHTPSQGDPDRIDDTDEFYGGETECIVFASYGKYYSYDMEKAVFYNGHWQNVE